MACSVLKKSYRDRLRRAAPGMQFVYLHGPQALILERLRNRGAHFMPASLLAQQFRDLEEPADNETDVNWVSVESSVTEIRDRLQPLMQNRSK